MKIDGEHVFSTSRDAVWAALTDPRVLAASVPGAKRLEVTGDHRYAVTVKAGVGAVTGTYSGELELTDQVAPERCTVRAAIAGAPGSVQTVAQMHLTTRDDGSTLLRYEADASVTGSLAGVGQRLLGAAAKRTTAQFLDAVAVNMQGLPAEQAGAGEAGAEQASAPAPGAVFAPPAAPPRAPGGELRVAALSAGAGFLLALLAVIVGRLTARR
ncbi:MAG: CoxG family protein [Conexibacter sp.]